MAGVAGSNVTVWIVLYRAAPIMPPNNRASAVTGSQHPLDHILYTYNHTHQAMHVQG